MSAPMHSLYPNPRDDPDNADLPTINHLQTILGTTITFLLLAIFAVALRLYSRLRDHLWGWDDAFVLLAAILSCMGDIVVCLMPNNGLGLHFWTLDHESKVDFFKHIWATNGAYCSSTACIKLAILFQYLRLFGESTKSNSCPRYLKARRLTVGLAVFVAIWGVVFTSLALFPCRPISKYWNFLEPGKCIAWGTKDPAVFFWMWALHSGSNMALDVIVFLLPIPFLSMLRLDSKSKFGIFTLFAMGGVVVAVSIGRMITLVVNRAGTIPIIDMTFATPTVYLFSILEVNIAIACASIPIFWPLIASFATNRILVVNEVVVQVEDYPKHSLDGEPGIGLAEQGAWRYDDPDGKDSPPLSRNPSILVKPFTRAHGRKPSCASLSKKLSFDVSRPRPSVDSNNLYRTTSEGDSPNGSLAKSDYGWLAELDQSSSKTTTKVEHAPVPFDHTKASS